MFRDPLPWYGTPRESARIMSPMDGTPFTVGHVESTVTCKSDRHHVHVEGCNLNFNQYHYDAHDDRGHLKAERAITSNSLP